MPRSSSHDTGLPPRSRWAGRSYTSVVSCTKNASRCTYRSSRFVSIADHVPAASVGGNPANCGVHQGLHSCHRSARSISRSTSSRIHTSTACFTFFKKLSTFSNSVLANERQSNTGPSLRSSAQPSTNPEAGHFTAGANRRIYHLITSQFRKHCLPAAWSQT